MRRIFTFSAVGCLVAAGFFLSLTSGDAFVAPTAPVTFTKDVAPIIQKNCVTCHRPGQIAPMSLLSYKEVRPWAKSIREVVVERRMPPWFADARYGEFSNDCRLSQKEIDTLVAWVSDGAIEGDPKDMPSAPKFSEDWLIGKPDVILSMTEEY